MAILTRLVRCNSLLTARKWHVDERTKLSAARACTLELSPAPRGASKVNVETIVTNGSLPSVPKTQATSVLPVAREESQRLPAGAFPEEDFGPVSLRVHPRDNFRVARDTDTIPRGSPLNGWEAVTPARSRLFVQVNLRPGDYCDLSTLLATPNSPQSGSGNGVAKDQTTVIGFSPVQDTKLTGPQ